MVNKIKHLFGKPTPATLEGNKKPYIAINTIKDEEYPKRYDEFTIFYEDGICKEIISYNYLMRAISIDPSKLTLFSTEGVYLIEGKQVDSLLNPLKERHIDFIRGYCDALHLKPVSDALLIERIDYLTNQDWYRFLESTDDDHLNKNRGESTENLPT